MFSLKKYLIAEIFPEHNKVYFFSYNNSEKQVIIERAVSFKNISGLSSFVKNFSDNNYLKIISLSPLLVTTDFDFYKFKRRQPDRPVDELELENLISQLVWNNVSANQLIVRNIKIDGHKATDPLGLTGKDIDIYFSRSRISEDFKKDLGWIFYLDQILLVGDAGVFLSHLMSQIWPETDPFILAAIYYDFSSLIICNNGQISEFQQINWGEKNLLSVIFGNLLLDQDTARSVWKLYCCKRMSAGFYGKLNDFLEDEFNSLVNVMQKAMNKSGVSRIHFMPFFDFSTNQLKLNKGKLFLVDNNFISHQLGFELKLRCSAEDAGNFLPAIALLAEADTVPADNLINKMTNRRLRWSNKNNYGKER